MGKTHLTRRELIKQDEFLEGMVGSWDYIQAHLREILIGVGSVAVVAAIGLGTWWYVRHRGVVTNEELTNAIQLFNSPLITDQTKTPLLPNQRVFATSQEKYSTAEKEFARLGHKFGGVIGDTALYYDAMCKFQLGDSAGAISQLESIGKKSNAGDVGALAKFSLAQIYGAQYNTPKVATLLQQLADHPTDTVPRVTALMFLAEYYQRAGNKEAAIQLFKKIQTEYPSYQVQADVSTHLSELGVSAGGPS
ncbi:MAG: tetratricopeptide repeat protein [Acidobacteriia bacterium]|nr:tetratricopeptide repeat protein [Terriglobia bacterium]